MDTAKTEEKSKLSKFKTTNTLINSSPTAINNLFNSLLLASANASSTYTDNSIAMESLSSLANQQNVNSNNLSHTAKKATAASPSKDTKLLENENKELKLKNNELITKIAHLENICNDLKLKHEDVGKRARIIILTDLLIASLT